MRFLLTTACALAAFSVSDAYTASNGLPPASAGAGSGAISGYAIADVRYELEGTAVASVSFTLVPPEARTARVRLAVADGWHPCGVEGGTAVCAVGAVELTALERLDVVAAG